MQLPAMPHGNQDALRPLADISAAFGSLASGLDARFVSAGAALSTAYEIVERLVASLEGVTNALNRQAADAAIDTMRSIAGRLTRLPEDQDRRKQSLATIEASGAELGKHLLQIRRTLDFLRICGLNIKVTASGAEGFASFADHMLDRLDQAEQQVDEFSADIKQLADGIGGMTEADRLLAAECRSIIPRVPKKLAEDARALQQHQADTAALAEQVAVIARDIRGKVAVALGSLQIGDITRQRLEHIAEGADMLTDVLAEAGGSDAAIGSQVQARVASLLAAQAADTVDDFLREARTLGDSLRGIGPDANRLLAVRYDSGKADDDNVLARLEQDIREMESVTRRLRSAESDSARLGRATSEAAEGLTKRLKAVRRIQLEVEQMAWNTALRCRDLGADGRGLAVLSAEIQQFSHGLAAIWADVAETFGTIDSAAAMIRDQLADPAEADTDATLAEALDAIRAGSARMTDSLSGVDREASDVADILRNSTGDLDCEAEIGATLAEAVEALTARARAIAVVPTGDGPSDAADALTAELMDRIAARYTMARERDIHRAFAPAANDDADVDAVAPANGVDDAGVDDDDLFDDALF